MDLDRFTQKSQEAIHDAETKAIQYGNPEIDVEHLLVAFLEQEAGLVPRLLESMDIDPSSFLREEQRIQENSPRISGPCREPRKIYISHAMD